MLKFLITLQRQKRVQNFAPWVKVVLCACTAKWKQPGIHGTRPCASPFAVLCLRGSFQWLATFNDISGLARTTILLPGGLRCCTACALRAAPALTVMALTRCSCCTGHGFQRSMRRARMKIGSSINLVDVVVKRSVEHGQLGSWIAIFERWTQMLCF